MFWLGMYAAQKQILQNIKDNPSKWSRVAVVCLAIGLPASLLYAQQLLHSSQNLQLVPFLTAMWLYLLGGPALGVAYIIVLSLLLRGESVQARWSWLAAVGRMALTNYLLQSVVCTLLFYNYGLGLYGKVGVTSGFVLSCLIFAAQSVLSVWWLRRYRFGPVEWLWRSATYGQRQPVRVD